MTPELLVVLILNCTAAELNLRGTQREDFLSFCLDLNQLQGEYDMLYTSQGPEC